MTEEEIDGGIKACLNNAERLNERVLNLISIDVALATFIAVLRLEEIISARMLKDAKNGDLGGRNWKQFGNALKNHTDKWTDYKIKMMNRVIGMSEHERRELLKQSARVDAGFKNAAMYAQIVNGTWRTPLDLDFSGQPEHLLTLGDNWKATL